ncbi:N-acetyltransferase [Leifsonia sp. LS1]|nr:N-acetyltransferase [Leifsonia sp. LS1]
MILMPMFPITTERFALSPLAQQDRDAFVDYRRVPDVARWQSWTPTYSTDDADELLASQPDAIVPQSGLWLQVAVRDRSTGALVGDVAVHALPDQPDSYELGVTIAPAMQGTGAAAEALRGLIAALFGALGAHRVCATTDARNTAAARLFTRLGFRHEGRAVEADWFKDEWTSVDRWALLRAECDRQARGAGTPAA